MEIEKISEHPDYYIGDDGSVFKKLKTWNNSGYETIKLEGKHHKIHELVAKKFLRAPKQGEVLVHRNGDKTNNKYSNLVWVEEKKLPKPKSKKGRSPKETAIKCQLYRKDELIGEFPSIKMAVRLAQSLGAKPSVLEKYKKQADFEIRIKEGVTTSPQGRRGGIKLPSRSAEDPNVKPWVKR